MSAAVAIVAVGARTPVGLTAASSAAAVRAGISRRALYPFIDRFGEPIVVAADARLDRQMEGRERVLPLIVSVLEELRRHLGEARTLGVPCHVLLALPEPRPGFSDGDTRWLTDAVRADLKSSAVRVEVVGRGHAGAMRAIEQGVQEISTYPGALFLVVGADSYFHPATFAWLEGNRRLAEPGIRSGFAPGEGAGGLALMSTTLSSRLGLPRLAGIGGVRTTQESRLLGSETGSLGVGMSEAVRAAVNRLVLPREGVDTIYTDINGERYRSEEWAFVALRTPLVWKTLVYDAPSDCWGDQGAAFGALAAVLSVQAFARGYARGPRALAMAGSDNGLRGALLLQAPDLEYQKGE